MEVEQITTDPAKLFNIAFVSFINYICSSFIVDPQPYVDILEKDIQLNKTYAYKIVKPFYYDNLDKILNKSSLHTPDFLSTYPYLTSLKDIFIKKWSYIMTANIMEDIFIHLLDCVVIFSGCMQFESFFRPLQSYKPPKIISPLTSFIDATKIVDKLPIEERQKVIDRKDTVDVHFLNKVCNIYDKRGEIRKHVLTSASAHKKK